MDGLMDGLMDGRTTGISMSYPNFFKEDNKIWVRKEYSEAEHRATLMLLQYSNTGVTY